MGNDSEVNPFLAQLSLFAKPNPQASSPEKKAEEKPELPQSEEQEYTDEELESFAPVTTDASYFEKAQDFKPVIKNLRITYLGLRTKKKILTNGDTVTVYIKDKKKFTGINEEGVEANIRFLQSRLGQHTVLSNWDEERMYEILHDDMHAWLDIMEQNYENYQLTDGSMLELRILINDLLESLYRRAMDNKERGEFKPASTEIRKIMDKLGIDTSQMEYGTALVDEQRKTNRY